MGRGKGYFTMGLNCGVGWPSRERTVCFRGHDLILKPETDTSAPSVVVKMDGTLSQQEARRLVQEFLSGLAWAKRRGVSETFSTFCTGTSLGVGKGAGSLVDDSPMEYVPDPADAKAKLALALYREALSVNVVPYQFLGFFKILNVLRKTGKEQEKWINDNIANIGNRDANKRLKELQKTYTDIGGHLYGSGRCAVAHAFAMPVTNPDAPEDVQRLQEDLPLVQALAEYAIEHEFGVKSAHTVDAEHLYELEGFRELFGEDTVKKLKGGEIVDASQLRIPKKLSLRLRDMEQLTSFENMDTHVGFVDKGVVGILLRSYDARVEARVLLSFTEERFTFNAMQDAHVHDDGSREGAASMIDKLKYFKGWLANGVNELWDSLANKRLARSQPVVVYNWRPNWDSIDEEMAGLVSRLAQGPAEEGLS